MRAMVVSLGVGLALVGVWALLFSRASATSWVADRTETLATIDVVLSDVEVTHERLKQSLLLASALETGTTTREVVDGSLDDVERRLAVLGSLELPASAEAMIGSYIERSRLLVSALRSADLAEASRIASGDLPSLRASLVQELDRERLLVLTDIRYARSEAGAVATGAGILLVLLVPGAMVFSYQGMARRQLRKARESAHLAAERELLERRNEFISGLSHELRTPLTGIFGLANLLAERFRLDPQTEEELVGLLVSQASDLSRMVDDLIATARAETGSLSFALGPISVAEQVGEVVASLRRSGHAVRVLIEEPDARVIADPIRLRHALHNLIDNALRHGGDDVRVSCRKIDDRYLIQVIDDGEGVSDSQAERLFDRYAHSGRDSLTTGSVGLGLSVVRALAEGMGGRVWYQRRDGLTYFVLDLPAAPAVPRRSQPSISAVADG